MGVQSFITKSWAPQLQVFLSPLVRPQFKFYLAPVTWIYHYRKLAGSQISQERWEETCISNSLHAGMHVVMLESCCHTEVQFVLSNVLPQTPQNVTVMQGGNNLILAGRFTMHDPVNVTENHQHALFAPDRTLTTGDEPECEFWVIPGLLMEILAGVLTASRIMIKQCNLHLLQAHYCVQRLICAQQE